MDDVICKHLYATSFEISNHNNIKIYYSLPMLKLDIAEQVKQKLSLHAAIPPIPNDLTCCGSQNYNKDKEF